MSCFRHGYAGTPTYKSWASMISRCTNPNLPYFKYYGGRGIAVCDRWLTFSNFVCDMGARPIGTTLDRINPDGDYFPGNCQWATKTEQQRNRRNTIRLSHNGQSLTLKEWSLELGMSYEALRSRYKKKWTESDILTIPVSRSNAYISSNHNRDIEGHFTRKP